MGMGKYMKSKINLLSIPGYYWKSILEIDQTGKHIKYKPKYGTCFDFFVNPDLGTEFSEWQIMLRIFDYDESVYFSPGIELFLDKDETYIGFSKKLFKELNFKVKFLNIRKKSLVFSIETENCVSTIKCIRIRIA